MTETKVGKVVYVSRAYTVAEVLEAQVGGGYSVIGYSVFGHRSDTTKVYSRDISLEVLRQLANDAMPNKGTG